MWSLAIVLFQLHTHREVTLIDPDRPHHPAVALRSAIPSDPAFALVETGRVIPSVPLPAVTLQLFHALLVPSPTHRATAGSVIAGLTQIASAATPQPDFTLQP
mmetsp:Transcript_4342/g.10566  ORF Transcript_4342/g.10566 Transcript_4342/m.10566 type:complete len:103 (-) Transcript_4342:20-328(-)